MVSFPELPSYSIDEAPPSPEQEHSERYALLSVSNKVGIVDFARTLDTLGYRIISTGGTAKTLTDQGLNVVPIQDITGNPESIDVGGPTMVRAAAKNFKNVLVVVDPNDYKSLAEALRVGSVDNELRQILAAKAFGHLSFYDAQISRHLRNEQFPAEIALPGRRSIDLRYGENPHQKGVVYFEPNTNSPLRNLKKLTGRELSYVNFTDIASGLESVRIFAAPSAVVIKHNSPSGIALGNSSAESLMRAVAADPESAFGGVIVLNQPLDIETAQTFASFKEEDGVVIDIVAAPFITDEARDFIRQVRKSTGIYTFGNIPQ